MSKLPIGLQLYTVRDDAARDFVGTVKKVAEIGYTGVELAGTGGLTIEQFKTLMTDTNLTVAGAHTGLEKLETEMNQVVDENLAIGNSTIIVPFLAKNRREDAAGYRLVAEALNTIAEQLAPHGLELSYHNHAFEFERQDTGERGIDILLNNTNPKLVNFEFDAYWVMVGGDDPVAMLSRNAGRVPNLHIKDRDPSDGSFAEIGTGDLPLDDLIAAANTSGVKWLVVEQDVCKRPPLEAVKLSFDNLKARGYA
jgi:sugar phosphate isomerase/epimerase